MLRSAPSQIAQLRRPATRIPTVCVVDPRMGDYAGWQATAEARGLRLQFVASAEEALRFSRASAVDLWVVNTHLPGLSGCELCAMLKTRASRTPVVMVADQHTPLAERQAWQARATMCVVKPTLSTLLTIAEPLARPQQARLSHNPN